MINFELITLFIITVILIILKFRVAKTTFIVILTLTALSFIVYYGYVFYTYLRTSNFNLTEAIKTLIERNKEIVIGVFIIWLVSDTITESAGGSQK